MSTRALLERRSAIVSEMRSITNSPAGNAGDLSAEQSSKFDSLKTELEGLEKRIARQQLVDDAERRMQGERIAGSGDNRLDAELSKFELRKVICAQVPDLKDKVDCGREIEISNELQRRAGWATSGMCAPLAALSIERRTLVGGGGSPDSGGINLIPTDHRADQFIDVLRAKMIVRRAGARILTGLMGDLDIPKQASSATASWVAEDSALSDSEPTYQKLQFSPKHCGIVGEYSRNMLLQSSPDIEQLLRMDYAKQLANALDVAAINGAGSNDPTGILNTSGLATVNGPVSWTAVLQIIETVEENNTEGTAFASTPGMKRLLRSTAKVSSTDSVMVMQDNNNLAGFPFFTTTNVPASLGSPPESDALIFGDWADLLIAIWSELDVLVNPFESAAYARGNVKVRSMMTVDLAPRHIESFCAMTNVSPG